MRMLMYLAALLLVLAAGVILFWFVQTRTVEIASYRVLETDGTIELRAYPALVVAEVTRDGTRDQAVRAGFRPLASYIFASERAGPKIAMTAPVTQTSAGQSWHIQFIMPGGASLSQLPQPAGNDVTLRELPAMQRAAIRFSGWWSDELFREQNTALLAWMTRRGLTPKGPPIFAYYNDPFTPGFLRRNEILYDLGRADGLDQP